MNTNDKALLIDSLWAFISENKKQKIESVVENRTRYVTVVMEDVFQPHNASAVLRSCDIFGIQDIHVVEARYKFKPVPTISMGSLKWLDIHRHSSTTQAISLLKSQGYRIVATTPHTDSYELPNLPIDAKTALIFGSEQTGLSDEAMQQADMFVKIPMYGFVESFNVSVSVALCLYDLVAKLHQSDYLWRLSDEEKQDLILVWISRISKTAELLQKESSDRNK